MRPDSSGMNEPLGVRPVKALIVNVFQYEPLIFLDCELRRLLEVNVLAECSV